jgi:hypothetical protein
LIQYLIEHGHRFDDVLDYTLAQIRMFVRAIDGFERARKIEQVILQRAAGATEDGFKTFLKRLREED